MLSLAPLLTACFAGWLLMRLIQPAAGAGPRWAAALLELGLGAGFGIGIASMIFFLLTVAGAASAGAVMAIDVVILAALSGLWFYRRRRRPSGEAPQTQSMRPVAGRAYRWILAAFLVACLIVVLDGMRLQAAAEPHGLWDAWAIWNIRAKFLAGPGETWRHAVSPLLHRTHPDYPLLLSGFVARCWKVAGSYSAAAPAATALVFFLATLAVLISTLALIRSSNSALLAGLVVMAGSTYLFQPMTQYSDIPLGYFYLSAAGLVGLAWTAEEKRTAVLLVLAGFAAGCAAWTKNEGLLFAAVFGCCFAAVEWWRGGFTQAIRRSVWLGAGMLPGLLLVGFLKAALAPVMDPIVREGHKRVAEGAMQDWRLRWLRTAVLRSFRDFGYGWGTHPAVLLAALAAVLRFSLPAALRPAVAFGAATLAVVFTGYVTVSLGAFTPFARFFSQLFPMFLLVFFLALRPLEQLLEQPAPALRSASEPTTKRTKKKRS